jgi:putative acetyltransferase
VSRAWRIERDDLSGTAVRALLEQHFAGMLANSPEGSCHFLDFAGLQADGVTFWSVWYGDDLAGCGALKQIDARHGEVKSMRVADAFRGAGAGHAMLDYIIAEARLRGYARLSLETGSGPAFADAARLYARTGFAECAPFADYGPDPFSRFMSLTLD